VKCNILKTQSLSRSAPTTTSNNKQHKQQHRGQLESSQQSINLSSPSLSLLSPFLPFSARLLIMSDEGGITQLQQLQKQVVSLKTQLEQVQEAEMTSTACARIARAVHAAASKDHFVDQPPPPKKTT
jgi:hypothetical protein